MENEFKVGDEVVFIPPVKYSWLAGRVFMGCYGVVQHISDPFVCEVAVFDQATNRLISPIKEDGKVAWYFQVDDLSLRKRKEKRKEEKRREYINSRT